MKLTESSLLSSNPVACLRTSSADVLFPVCFACDCVADAVVDVCGFGLGFGGAGATGIKCKESIHKHTQAHIFGLC